MRIAFFCKRKARTRTTRSIAAALERAGHPVLVVHERRSRRLGRQWLRDRMLRSVRAFSPDVVLVHARDISRETFDVLAADHPMVTFTPDCWSEPYEPALLAQAQRSALLFTVAKGQIPDLVKAGVRRVAYLAEAFDPAVHHAVGDVGPGWRSDVAFIGKTDVDLARMEGRTRLVQRVAERFDTKVYGDGWSRAGIRARRRNVYPRHYRLICRGARIVLGRDWTTECAWYFSNRTWFTLGCGGFLLTNYVPGLEEIFRNHGQLVWYRSEDECLELIEHYLARPDARERIAASGRDFALSCRTSDHFARDLVDLLEGRAPSFPPD